MVRGDSMNSDKPALLGGTPTRGRPYAPRKTMGEAERRAAIEVLDSDVLSAFLGAQGDKFNGGPQVRAFEQEWASRYGFKHAISVNSWTSGLVTCYGAVGISPGDEIICPPYTMSASATSALYGGIPVFADVDPETFCIDPRSIEQRLTPRTKAIMVVHLFGRAADMDPILAIARAHNLRVIEDAAQAPGVYYRGKPVGALGDVGGFSFNYHKHIHTGEGGMIVTNDDAIAERCRRIRNHGENAVESPAVPDEELTNAIGGNYRLTELQAAIGIAQHARLQGILETRRAHVRAFRNALRDVPGIWVQPATAAENEHAYYVLPLKYDAKVVGLSRSLFVKAVNAELPTSSEGPPLIEGYVRPLYLSRIYQEQRALGREHFPFSVNREVKYDYSKGLCPVTERLHEQELCYTPVIHEALSTEDVLDLATAIRKVVKHAGELGRRSDEPNAAQ